MKTVNNFESKESIQLNNTTNQSAEKPHKHEKKVWYKLDLSAIVYPTLQRRDFSSVYRESVVLKEPVQPDILQQAVDIALTRFPTYKTAIRKGLFWRYLEPNNRPRPFKRTFAISVCPCPLKQEIDICFVFIIMTVELPWKLTIV